ncbi:HlyD family secretion protein [Azospirillum brasilense]|uniref:HlyD family secretion protein n=1 Tax=Azospirillum brasilense TaxID=192 RepID=UPI000E688767|nr:HlyD family efflux transporter periplasmic adaptor subunit [Azospirillum brasilense]NUB24497.1 HlyD family efflux transporter periplasmic adaptor subunit [Azospirillum brasilense]NUB32933.1 HlyD family efflux transporter periplasmic adaptor subunit [Azospirillum brasilense]RIW05718.1 HlyD family efflux transporter periplasmic adaptor subunit [Azospirillum brasilense]
MSWIAETLAAALAVLGLGGGDAVPLAHGYAEGEYLRIAAPVAGTLDTLAVTRGGRVEAGAPLFALDRTSARAERDRLAAALGQARAELADLRTGRRPDELAVVSAQRAQAEAALRYSEVELARQQTLVARKVSSDDRLDAARASRDGDRARLEELTAQLAVSNLPARPEQIRAAENAVAQAEAALAQAEKRLTELAPPAPEAALVEDTLFNPGEWVPAGAPVVSLLPPGKRKLVVFVPEPLMARVRPGDRVTVRCDGCPPGLSARVTYVAPRVEYTPPVIYSVGSREKLVFRVEARLEDGATLNPGLPVDVELPP